MIGLALHFISFCSLFSVNGQKSIKITSDANHWWVTPQKHTVDCNNQGLMAMSWYVFQSSSEPTTKKIHHSKWLGISEWTGIGILQKISIVEQRTATRFENRTENAFICSVILGQCNLMAVRIEYVINIVRRLYQSINVRLVRLPHVTPQKLVVVVVNRSCSHTIYMHNTDIKMQIKWNRIKVETCCHLKHFVASNVIMWLWWQS